MFSPSKVRFQSLIGILQTKYYTYYGENKELFQSLIGILQTNNDDMDNIDDDKFQSLIGILQTYYFRRGCFDCRTVSIPHRYSTNL